jgi:hypothetical protein
VAAEKDPTQCIFAQVVAKYISTPVFALQSVVDNHQVCPGCSCDNCTNQQEINEWAHRMQAALTEGFLSGPNAKVHGVSAALVDRTRCCCRRSLSERRKNLS